MKSIQTITQELNNLRAFRKIVEDSIDDEDENVDAKHMMVVKPGNGLVGYKRVTKILIPIGDQNLFICDIQNCMCVGSQFQDNYYYCDGHKQRIMTHNRYIADTGKGTGPKCTQIETNNGLKLDALLHTDGVAVCRTKGQKCVYYNPSEFNVLQTK